MTKPTEMPYLHVRWPRRVMGVGREGEPLAKVHGYRASLLALRAQIDAALAAEEEDASMNHYREAYEQRCDLVVMRSTNRKQMSDPRRPDRPDRSMLT